jgi:hypothetical protein
MMFQEHLLSSSVIAVLQMDIMVQHVNSSIAMARPVKITVPVLPQTLVIAPLPMVTMALIAPNGTVTVHHQNFSFTIFLFLPNNLN